MTIKSLFKVFLNQKCISQMYVDIDTAFARIFM
jgi:hypothetical protein